jgi:hypothetical protein
MRTLRTTKRPERGSALLVSLMVMVGLSLLGLGFVAISETESAISVNERNYAETLAVAEAGARAVVEMFQDADWAKAHDLLPPNSENIKNTRVDSDGNNIGYYKELPTQLLFDSPFKPATRDMFYGDENTPDVEINASMGTTATNYLDDLNEALLGTDTDLRISEILVFSPPMVNNDRFGVATVKVTAEKMRNDQPIARRAVKIVVGETPLPGASGPIQTEGALDNSGNFEVYWGKVTAVDDLKVIRPAVGLPWFDAAEVVHYEYGYDSTEPWDVNKTYAEGDLVHAPKTARDAVPDLRRWAYKVKVGAAGVSAAAPPDPSVWPLTENAEFVDNTITWVTVPGKQFIVEPTDPYSAKRWLHELVGKTIQDPWFQARTRGTLCYNNNCIAAPAGIPHPWKYDNILKDEENLYSNMFQLQTHTQPNDRIEVTFPTIDYEFWKEIAQSAEPDSGIIYLQWVPADQEFRSLDNVQMTAIEWLNAIDNGYGAGFYFFDTANGMNPQYGAGGTLTPAISINASDKGPSGNLQLQGFYYLNATYFGTSGQGSTAPEDVYPTPGEPYRDVGYRRVDKGTKKYIKDAAGDFEVWGSGNGGWDFEDVDEDGEFDVYTESTSVINPQTGVVETHWLPVIFFDNCSVGVTCSEPHEPYLNLIYPAVDDPKGTYTIGWHPSEDTTYMRPKVRLGENDPNVCEDDSNELECTGNWHDDSGALVRLAPLLNGILYNEGGYDAGGNAVYYGSLLIRGDFQGNGSPEVYFNECILKNCWQEQLNLPKVMIQSIQTDQ